MSFVAPGRSYKERGIIISFTDDVSDFSKSRQLEAVSRVLAINIRGALDTMMTSLQGS